MGPLSIRNMLRWMAFALPVLSVTYLVRFRFMGLPSTLLEVVLGVFVIGTFATATRAEWMRVYALLRGWKLWIGLWVLATVIAVFASPSLWTGFGLWRAYILEPLLAFVTALLVLDQPGDRRRMEYGMMIAAIGVSAWAIVGFFGNWGIPHPWNVSIAEGRRAVGPFGFPNGVALFVTPIGALVAARLATLFAKEKTHRSWKEWMLPLGTLVLIILALVAAKSDGGMLALGFVIALSLLGLRWGRWLVAVGAVMGAIGLTVLPGVRDALIQEATFQGWSGKVRLFIWKETWEMLKDHWLFGAGFGGYPVVFDAYHKVRFIEIFQYPHTILFNFWTETGLLGVVAFGGIVWRWIRDAVGAASKTYLPALVLLGPLLAILIHGLVDVPYFKNDLALLFWLFAWLILAAKKESIKLA